jgi:hypothetical protein
MQLDLLHMMVFIYWTFIQIRALHATWTTSKLLYPFVFCLFSGDIPKEVQDFWLFTYCFFILPLYHMIFILFFPTFPHFREETRVSEENQPAENKFVPLSQRVLSCAAHPLSHTIIAGTQVGLVLWSHT